MGAGSVVGGDGMGYGHHCTHSRRGYEEVYRGCGHQGGVGVKPGELG